MVIRDLNVYNKFINFSNITLDFSSKGIYLISGKNGCGKTSIIEKIVFGDCKIEFTNKEHDVLYHKNRNNLFAYVAQDVIGYETTLHDYIKKNNAIEDSDIKHWVDLMYPEGIDLLQSFATLSGGEKKKAAIIAAFLKDTPYIILDEPTNSLDDKSVQILGTILTDLSKEKTIIIVTHDERLNCSVFCHISIENNSIHTVFNGEKNANHYKTKHKNERIYKVLLNAIQPKKDLPFFALITVIIILVALVNQWVFGLMFSTEQLPQENMICIYTVDEAYGELNKKYTEAENLNISEDKYYNMLSYSDVDKINQLDGVVDFYLWDVELFYTFFDKFSNNEDLISDFYIFAIPQSIITQEVIFGHFGFQEMKYLEKGRMPDDNKKEVSISKNLLINKYGFSSSEAENAIGKHIIIDDEKYEIVGIQYIDICMLSFDTKKSYGVYTYNEETYAAFKTKILNYINANELSNKNISTGLITTENGKEAVILNELMEEYPAHNYYSNHFAHVFRTQNNMNFNIAITILNSLIGIFTGLSIMFAKKKQLLLQSSRIKDYGNYYICKHQIKTFNTMFILLQNIVSISIGILIVYLLSLKTMIFSDSVVVIVYTFLLICLPSTIMALVKNKC